MSEFSFSNTSKKTGFSSLLFSDLLHCCFFILSHPLYFSYFIFFSPYLLKLLSFLSPLFITTSLLLLAFLTTVSPSLVQDDHSHSELFENKVGFLAATYQNVVERLRSKVGSDDEEFQLFEELDVYKIVFEEATFEIREEHREVVELVVKETCLEANEAPVDKYLSHDQGNVACAKEDQISKFQQDTVEIPMVQPVVEVETLKWFLQEHNEFEDISCEEEDGKVKPRDIEGADKVEEPKEKRSTRSESKAVGNKIKDAKVCAKVHSEDGDGYYTPREMVNSPQHGEHIAGSDDGVEFSKKVMEASNLGNFGSMRKEKEWRRTLACKLFEERHNAADGGEGMDMLWETYETESNRALTKSNTKKGKKGGLLEFNKYDEDDVDDSDGQLCCLQALKFSAGKMNLGMGRPNLVKISKALKGIGWLHNLSRGKKGYH
ncbi:hypothetical protein FNV43_RR26393 [Rhamnella rubrinervis]|uniref:Uncharacterized protein n=1 Tax=Rhamnella rubrinervis TaxID=2594499 RepID=A0A8K0DJM1_9ROSA|nr:hypothetical protein FNV43_RR26393 [Rhamnella rubrinervis]